MIAELTNHLWQSTFFAAAVGFLTVAFRRNRAKVRYWLWFSASVKFFVPFALLVSLGSHLEWAPAARNLAAPVVSIAMAQIAQPFPEVLRTAPVTPRHANWIPIAMLCAWACGFAGVAAVRSRGWLRVRSAVRSSTAIDIPATVEVRSAPGLLEPGVVGLLRPILLLPVGIAERLTPPQLEAVLAHELCHVRRRDNLHASIHMVVEAMFWFHPLVWWIGARLVEARERACDEEVLSLGNEPHVYAEGILNVCKFYLESPLVCVSGVTGSNLKRRIEDVMTNRIGLRLTLAKKVSLTIVGTAALAAPLVIGMMRAPAMPAQSQVPVPDAPTAAASTEALIGALPLPLQGGRAMAPQIVAQSVQAGRLIGPQPAAAPAVDDEHSRRVAYAQAKFGNTRPGGMGGVYVDYGPPDEVDDQSSDAQNPRQIWRYNYLEDFHSNVEFEFPIRGLLGTRISFPPPVATYEGEPGVAPILVDVLGRERQSQGGPVAENAIAGLPGRHASFQIYPVKWLRTLSVPLDSLSGQVDVIAEVRTRPETGEEGRMAANLRDLIQASAGTMQATFGLDPGSYVCHVLVRERATGRMFGETIDFEAK